MFAENFNVGIHSGNIAETDNLTDKILVET